MEARLVVYLANNNPNNKSIAKWDIQTQSNSVFHLTIDLYELILEGHFQTFWGHFGTEFHYARRDSKE